MVDDIKSKRKVLHSGNEAKIIWKYMQTWKEITLDQWVNDTFIGAKIKTDKLTKVPCAGSTHHKNLSNIKKTHFKKETKRPMEQRVTKHVTEQESGYIPSIFLRENKNNKHVLILTLK